jgi:excisionase family DNA binding protein
MPNEDRWYSVNEVAAHLGVAVDTVYRWIENKSLPAHRIGRLWKCKLSEVDEWVRAGGIGAPAKEDSRPKKRRRG